MRRRERSATDDIPADGGGRPAARRRVVLVEDDASIGMSLSMGLPGLEIEEANRLARGLAVVRRVRPDAVLVDRRLPDGDGLDLVRQLRAEPALRGVAVVVLTASFSEADRSEVMAAGADAYIGKPFDIDQLDAAISDAIRIAVARSDTIDLTDAAITAPAPPPPPPSPVVERPEPPATASSAAPSVAVNGQPVSSLPAPPSADPPAPVAPPRPPPPAGAGPDGHRRTLAPTPRPAPPAGAAPDGRRRRTAPLVAESTALRRQLLDAEDRALQADEARAAAEGRAKRAAAEVVSIRAELVSAKASAVVAMAQRDEHSLAMQAAIDREAQSERAIEVLREELDEAGRDIDALSYVSVELEQVRAELVEAQAEIDRLHAELAAARETVDVRAVGRKLVARAKRPTP